MGVSRGYQDAPQKWAGDAKASAAATKKPVCEHRSLSTPPLPGAGAARHCQGPVIRGQLPPGEHTARLRLLQCHARLCCLQAHPAFHTHPSPQPE